MITGAPGSGKSTLLAEVARRGIATGDEVARRILQVPGGMEMRAERPTDFALAMLEAQRALWDCAGKGDLPILFDRGFPDIVGFLRLEGLAVSPEVDAACRNYRYGGPVFHAPPWREIYRQDDERIQTWEEAVESDSAVLGAWRDYGYSPVTLPFADPATRADFVLERL
ncbi:AAA family ATPase [Alteriqipengyuania lutimaris]|uniref:AAA family ATPase n=1 Tax=Alteriqipengyuania lutimaris TaxID=1538146 RepID=UPI0017A3327A|nr:AAA family ATPase [Alteriqipengyuania lutimaris]MBB3034438.1 putative ATPase [Alteriqipengyuania lutimaris]